MEEKIILSVIVSIVVLGSLGLSQDVWAVNTDPIVDAGADDPINEGVTFISAGSFIDPDGDTWTATVDYGDGTGVQGLTLVGKTFSLNHIYTNEGSFTISVNYFRETGEWTRESSV